MVFFSFAVFGMNEEVWMCIVEAILKRKIDIQVFHVKANINEECLTMYVELEAVCTRGPNSS